MKMRENTYLFSFHNKEVGFRADSLSLSPSECTEDSCPLSLYALIKGGSQKKGPLLDCYDTTSFQLTLSLL